MQELVVERIHEGLAFYAQGRIEDAVRAWVDAKRVGAGRVQSSVDEYLAFVREILPAVHEALEAELGPFLDPPAPPPAPEPSPPIALPESDEPGSVVFDVDTAEIFATADLDAAPAPAAVVRAAPPVPAPAPVLATPSSPAAAPASVATPVPPPAPAPVVAVPPRMPEIELDVPTDTAGESLSPATPERALTQPKPASTQPSERPRHGAARTPARAVVVRAAPGVARLVSTRTQKHPLGSVPPPVAPTEPPPSSAPATVASPATGTVASSAPAQTAHSADPWGSEATVVPDATVDTIASGFSLVASQPVSAVEPTQEVGAASELSRHEARLTELEELDDFSGIITTATAILALDADHARAQAAQKRARERLSQMHASRLGSLDTVPAVLVAPDQVIWLDLDQRAGFILSQIDGFSSFQDILEISGMDQLEVLAILARLVEAKVIGPASSR